MTRGLGLVGLSHVSINTADLGRAEHFYLEILGGERVFEFINERTGARYGVFISLGNGTFLEIFNQPDVTVGGTQKERSSYRHICLEVRSIDMASEWLRKFGFQTDLKVGRLDGVPQFFITGPDGVEIEFHEYREDFPQRHYLKRDG